ncbi:MAG: YceI family protein [Candidatus Neomarinimicrobiota bacterium]|nr:YceI family protein [Candidatus Neomarinimicrobiota bacterium]|tara:strand:- start:1850 stop:2485 length:636 start_codon:yes stop_codon:yes gene_type:complete
MMKKILLILFLFLAGCGTKKDTEISSNSSNIISPEQGLYSVVIDETELLWIGKELSTKIHTGTLNLSNGLIQVDNDKTITGNVTINMSTINVTDLQGRAKEMLEGHLRSADFFEVENFPEATLSFKSKSFNKLKNQINFEGELIIKDISNPIIFNATLLESSPYLKAKAILSFDRSKYDVRFRSGSFFENLGDKLILDDIDVNITLVTRKQ